MMQRYFIPFFVTLYLAVSPAQASPPVQEVHVRDLSAWMVSEASLPIFTLEMAWRGGAATDPDAKSGLSMLMARLMNEGAGDMPAKAFQQALADKAISLSFNAGRDEVTGKLRCLKRYQQTCVRLLKLALTAPRFDAEAVARMKQEQSSAILRAQQSPSALASSAFLKMAFGAHPYGRSKDGTQASLARLTRGDIQAHYHNTFARDNLKLALVGDMTRAQTRRLMRDVFAALPAQANLPRVPDVLATRGPKTKHIERRGPQTSVTFGHRGVAYKDDLFFPAFVMNSILGGSGFSSRLTEEVREARGLAYSVYSYFLSLEHGDLWLGSVASDNKTTQQALDVIRAQMRRIAKDGVAEPRLEAAKTYMTGAYALRFDSGAKIAQQLIGVQLSNWPLDYFKSRNQRIEAVQVEDIKAAAQRLLADELLLVSVGQTPVSLAK
ncbi:MAG: insulinase family protein [Rhodobiaceae bacterium]|jgi:zinc protease|nr:insulinase family protein [Rhodobiaceae bacterium]